MVNSSLLQLLRSFSKKEFNWFVKFANSPYFNTHKDISALVAYLESAFPNFTEKNCNRELIFKKVFPKKKFDLKKLKHLFSFTIALAEDFLVIQKVEAREKFRHIYLLDQLSEKELDSRFQRQLKKLNKKFDEVDTIDQEFFYQRYILAKLVNTHHYKQTNRNEDENLGNIDHNLDIFYLSEKLRNACLILSRNITFKSSVQYPLMNDILQYVERNKDYFKEHPLVLLYFQIYQILTKKEDQAFFLELIARLEKESINFSVDEQQSLFSLCTSFCIKQINKGYTEHLAILFSLFKIMLSRELLLEGGFITEWRYKNLVTVGCRLKEFEWTEKFIHDYKPMLQKPVRENAFNYNLASYFYAVSKMEDALGILNTVKFTDLVYILDSRTLLLKIYYDLDEEETMTYQLEAFQSYLKRNKSVSDKSSKRYLNLLKYLKKLVRLRSNLSIRRDENTIDDLVDLKAAIELKRRETTNPPWILSKIDELLTPSK